MFSCMCECVPDRNGKYSIGVICPCVFVSLFSASLTAGNAAFVRFQFNSEVLLILLLSRRHPFKSLLSSCNFQRW